MAPLQKQNVNMNFAQGVDEKTDPNQVQLGKMLVLQNSIFQKGGLLQKRNGYTPLTILPAMASYLTTFNGNLTAIGNQVFSFAQGPATWVSKGTLQSMDLSTLPLIRAASSNTQTDSAIAANGLVCVAYTENATYQISVLDSVTGQNVIAPFLINSYLTTGVAAGNPRVFILGNYFLIVFTNNVSGTFHLQYIAININNPTLISNGTDISTQYTPASSVAFDGAVFNNTFYIAWNGSDGGGAIRLTSINRNLAQSATTVIAGKSCTRMSVCVDATGSTADIYFTFGDSSNNAWTTIYNFNLTQILAPTQILTGVPISNLTSVAQNGIANIFYEIPNNYTYGTPLPSHLIRQLNITQSGTITPIGIVLRGVGIASKAFLWNGHPYLLSVYQSPYQSTYFFIDTSGHILAKLAYSNAGGYLTTGLPSVTLNGNAANISYLFQDLIQPVNKTQGVGNSLGFYSQTGINLVTLVFTTTFNSAEIGNNLHLSGGILYAYDGASLVEQGFHLWPDNVGVTTSTTGGFLADQQYFYQVIYQWTDLQGNIHRSAPSTPVGQVTAGGNTSSNTLNINTLRETAKVGVQINIYRWSVAQQVYYRITNIPGVGGSVLLNNPATDSVGFVDTVADANILGNDILYTTGGVVEDIGPPATTTMTLFKSRLFLLDAENRNLLWYSKQVIQGTPVEMSDLFTIYVAPTIGAQSNTGNILALSAMDDKLVIFKRDAIYYLTGNGPDNTGANNDFSDPTFIAATVGCIDQHSIVLIPQGLLFQSDKGIWLLGRDLSTSYLGAPVETSTQNTSVLSSVNPPGTNQVRITLDNNVTLMYDYFYNQWGTFTGIPAIASTIYNELHTYIDTEGRVFQETPGLYLDGTNPVLMSFTTAWINLMGLQGFERAYYFLMLAKYITPHKINFQIAYDYDPSIVQTTLITPTNYSAPYGGDAQWGGGAEWGGSSNIEQWRIFLQRGKCESFQITLNEIYDPTLGVPAGAGFTLSGLNLVIGAKKGYNTLRPSFSAG